MTELKQPLFQLNSKKEGKGDCLKNMITNADNFSIPFPQGADWKHRCLLMAAGLLIDYRMFENKNKNQNKGRRYHGH